MSGCAAHLFGFRECANIATVSLSDEALCLRHYAMLRKRRAKNPDGYAVHHTDGNPYNNNLDNLRLVKINKEN